MAAVFTSTEGLSECESEGISSENNTATENDAALPILISATNIKVEDTSEDPGYADPSRRQAAATDVAPLVSIKEERVEDEDYVQIQLGDVGSSSENIDQSGTHNDSAHGHGTPKGKRDWLFRCVDCGETFEQREVYLEHQREHTHDGPIVCLDSDSQWNDLLVSEDGGRRTLCCAICGRKFSNSRGFFTHQLKHRNQALKQEPVTEVGIPVNKQRIFECSDCGKTYSSVGLYLNHQRSHKQASKSVFHQLAHLKKKSFQCPTCSRCYSRASALDAHRRCHEVKLIKSRTSGTERTLKSLEVEEEMNGDEAGEEKKSRPLFNCSECGKTFRSLSGLNIHQRYCCNSKYPEVKPKEEIKRSFKCPECDKSFLSNTALASHQRWHVRRAKISSSGQSLACEECGKVFSSLTFFDKHKRLVHSGETPAKSFLHQVFQLQKKSFECQDCGRRFSRASALQSHQLCHTDVFGDVIERESQKSAATAAPPQKLYLCDKERPESFAIGTLAYSQGTPQSLDIDQFACKDTDNEVEGIEGNGESFSVDNVDVPGSGSSRDENAPFLDGSTGSSLVCELNPEVREDTKMKGSASPLRSESDVYVQLEVEPVQSRAKNAAHEIKNFECPECGRKFGSASAIHCHRLWHKRPMGRAASHKTWSRNIPGRTYLKKLFKCNDCGKESHTLSSHHLHLQQHERPKPYKSLFFQLAGLQKNSFECKECGMRFSRASALQSHQQHHRTAKRIHECPLCDKAYSSHVRLYNHHKTCHGEWSHEDAVSNLKKDEFNPRKSLLGPKVYHCERCGKGFWSLGAFSQHNQSQHCPEVKENADLPEPLVSISSHSRASRKCVVCPVCGKKYRHRGYLTCHMKTHRSTLEKNHRCEVCGKSYQMLACFLKHQQVHDGCPPPVKSFQHQVEQVKKNTYGCPDCGKRFSRAMALQFHMRSHGYETGYPFNSLKSAKLFQCSNCADHFSNETDLKDHLSQKHADAAMVEVDENTHIQEQTDTDSPESLRRSKDLQAESNNYIELLKNVSKESLESSELPLVGSDLGKYKCGECGRGFSVIGALNFHKRIHCKAHTVTHSVQNAFMCQECGRSFNTKPALGRHRRWHTDRKCDETFDFPSLLSSNCAKSLKCSRCNMAFCSVESLRTHQSQVHFKNVPCNQPNTPALTKDRYFTSKKTKYYECLECSKRFFKAKGLRIHRWHMHRGSGKIVGSFRTALKPFPCTGCDKRYSSQGALYNHRKICAMVRRKLRQQKTLVEQSVPARRFSEPFSKCLFKCQKCGKAFPSVDRLEAHNDVAKSRPHSCALCCRGYWSETQLQQHLAWHDEVRRRLPADLRYRLSTGATATHAVSGQTSRPKQQETSSPPAKPLSEVSPACTVAADHHKCLLCEEVFQTTVALKQHQLTHSDRELYPCPLCPQTFSEIQELLDHHQHCMDNSVRQNNFETDPVVPDHTRGSNELTCIECGITFSQEVELHQHYIEHARGEF